MADEHIYLGIMSGTSIDGLDIGAVSFSKSPPELIVAKTVSYPTELQNALATLCVPGDNEIDRMGKADRILGNFIGDAVNQFITENNLKREAIKAITSHGQTIRHRPEDPLHFTLQIGDPNQIAQITGCTVVADVRRKDMAANGQGAPLAPAFHNAMLRSKENNRIVLNLGGIANITCLNADTSIPATGFDTGPSNGLMNQWIGDQQGKPYDNLGLWAQSGKTDPDLLAAFLKEAYFQLPAPKSTGRELFNLQWLKQFSSLTNSMAPEDVQRTLLELTVTSITDAIFKQDLSPGELILCGGGVHNKALVNRLEELAAPWQVKLSSDFGINPDYMEVMAFAWIGKRTLEGLAGNLKAVTGADEDVVLGAIYSAH